MATYRIYRLKDKRRAEFRWSPHTLGLTMLRPRDYDPDGVIQASSPYNAWAQLRNSEHPLQVGDVLEEAESRLFVYKYVGFVEAQWAGPEASPATAEPLAEPEE